MEHFDVVVVGAGLSGIGAGCHLQRECPRKSYVILEGRDAIGGTWDLFRYPGIRSDSDMFTLGYIFQPWTGAKAIADGASILSYVRETAARHGVDKRIRFNHAVERAAWSSADARWTVEAVRKTDGEAVRFTCNFLHGCAGYYDYEQGYDPPIPGADLFEGRVVHPQHWPSDLDYAGKRVVIVGSGATAVTLAPEMAKTAAHVTMLQRSPTYIVSRPSADAVADRLRRNLPPKLAYAVTRWRNVLLQMWIYRLSRRQPARVKAGIIGLARQALGPDYDVATHLTPSYNPWDQRLCLIPDGDLFDSLKAGTSLIVTDQIETFTREGLKLKSGRVLPADVVVKATGLKVKMLGGIKLTVDGAPVDFPGRLAYKGVAFEGVPNLTSTFGYINASWTLKADLTCTYMCRLLNYMDRRGYDVAMPKVAAGEVEAAPFLDFSSGYVQRAASVMPKQGTAAPWKVNQNYVLDIRALRYGKLDDGVMTFARKPATADERRLVPSSRAARLGSMPIP